MLGEHLKYRHITNISCFKKNTMIYSSVLKIYKHKPSLTKIYGVNRSVQRRRFCSKVNWFDLFAVVQAFLVHFRPKFRRFYSKSVRKMRKCFPEKSFHFFHISVPLTQDNIGSDNVYQAPYTIRLGHLSPQTRCGRVSRIFRYYFQNHF